MDIARASHHHTLVSLKEAGCFPSTPREVPVKVVWRRWVSRDVSLMRRHMPSLLIRPQKRMKAKCGYF